LDEFWSITHIQDGESLALAGILDISKQFTRFYPTP